VTTLAALRAPDIDYAGLSPLFALAGGACLTLMLGLFKGRRVHGLVVGSSLLTLAAATGLSIWQLGENKTIVEGALRVDDLALTLDFAFFTAAALTVILSIREPPSGAGREGDYYTLLLSSVLGMVVLAGAFNLVTLFIGFELLSIPLYVMCAGLLRKRTSLEAGLKYLIIGSVGSATLLYGLAFVYGATGSTDFTGIVRGMGENDVLGDPLLLVGIALSLTGLAFKASVAPFHQWTPDVYQGAPTPVTAFMAVATKAAAFAIIIRYLGTALFPAAGDWDVPVAVLAATSIIVGNVGALGQRSLKRMLAWSGVAQAGYMMAGAAVLGKTDAADLATKSIVFYLLVYLVMNVAAFAVVIARERETPLGDDIAALDGIGGERPLLAWPMTISMLALAGMPGTAGFIGKFFLIEATVDGDFTWLGVAIVIGTMISLAYYLRVIAAIWMRPAPAEEPPVGPHAIPAMAGGSQEADADLPRNIGTREVVAVAVLCGAASLFFGIVPSPLLDLASDAVSAHSAIR
jgi:NADH-quinone oxidoreductase subunit N